MTFNEIRKLILDINLPYGWELVLSIPGELATLQVLDPKGFCNETGEPMAWKGRKWFISMHMTKSEIVQTAFKAVMTAAEHEIRESFLYRSRAIFCPHYDVDQLHALRGEALDNLDVRSEPPKAA